MPPENKRDHEQLVRLEFSMENPLCAPFSQGMRRGPSFTTPSSWGQQDADRRWDGGYTNAEDDPFVRSLNILNGKHIKLLRPC